MAIRSDVLRSRARFLKNLVAAKVTNKPNVLLVTFSLEPRCNFDCGYCYGDYHHRPPKLHYISSEDALSAVDQLADLGMSFMQISGGEPLLRKDLDLIVDRALARGVVLGMSTNGSLIEKRIDVVKKIKTVAISFDGDPVSNDANRGKGTHEEIVRGIRAAKRAGVKVHLYMTVTKNNVGAIDYTMEFAKEFQLYMEFGFPVVGALKTAKDESAYRGMDLTVEEFRAAVRKLVDYKNRGYPILFSRKIFEKVLVWPDYIQKTVVTDGEEPDFDHVKCYAGRHQIFIDADGKVYPCIQHLGTFKALDFREVGMKKAIENSGDHNCKACYLMCVNDFNLMFSLDLTVLWNNLKVTMKETLASKGFDEKKFNNMTGLDSNGSPRVV